jgi:long-chain acyl-CoA synthetase
VKPALPPVMQPSPHADNLVDLARASVARFATRPLFGERRNGAWRWMTYREWQGRVDAVRAALAGLGVGPGDRVAIASRNSADWAAAAYATYGLRATFVPMYEAQRPEDWELILRDCEASVVLGRTAAIAESLAAMRPRLPALRHVITIEGTASDAWSLPALIRRGPSAPFAAAVPDPEDLAALIYTPGTTGLPKGVMLTHANLTSNVVAALAAFPVVPGDRTLSLVPWAHVHGQVCELHVVIAAGASAALGTDAGRVLEALREVRPTLLVAVPRILDRLYFAVRAQIAQWPPASRGVFERGVSASQRSRRGERLVLRERIACWRARFRFAAIRRTLGGRLRCAISGGAMLAREVGELFDGLGIAVYEGYGLTEASPIVTMNRPGRRRIGSAGRPIANVAVEIDETRGDGSGNGEIVVHGPNVMRGYHARHHDTVRAFTADGGLRTGDLGYLDDAGYLHIAGRIKEQYELENGKRVMPGPLEERLAVSPFIRHVVLHGAGRPYNVALVAIDEARVRAWGAQEAFVLGDDLTQDERVRELVQDELDRCSRDFRCHERPIDCALTTAALTVENGLLTPTLAIRRRAVEARFAGVLDAMYGWRIGAAHAAAVTWPSARSERWLPAA